MTKNKNLVFVIFACFMSCLFFSGCSQTEVIQTDDSQATTEGIKSVVDGNNQFTFDMYSELKTENNGNLFFSPYSISSALVMTYEGAKGKTAEEMKNVFYFMDNKSDLRSSYAKIYNNINEGNKDYKLSCANALWTQIDYPFLENYTNLISQYYGGKATDLDFAGDAENSRQTINTWVEDNTNNKIKDLIPQGVLNSDTKLVLTNAIYFKGQWGMEFDKDNTRKRDFHVANDKTTKVDMMSLRGDNVRFNYAEIDDLQILEMPYKGDDLSMMIFLPEENDGIENLEKLMSAEKFEEWKNSLKKQNLDVYMPKFKFETKYFMKGSLSNMGISSAFSEYADFSGMDGTRNLSISGIIHQAFVEVNEEGTEATAATTVVMTDSESVKPPKPIFNANHPFVFLIQQKETGNILFLGKVVNPNQ